MDKTTETTESASGTDELIEFLSLRMFPDKLTVSAQSDVVSGARKAEMDSYLESVAEYEEELQALSPDALMQLIEDEQQKDATAEQEEAARVETERFFNKPTARAYYRSWVERNYWTLDEATALILGKDPKVVNWDSIDPLVHKSAFARRYESLRRQFLRARFDGMLFEPLVPADFLRYAKTVGFALPVELDALLRSDDEEQARRQKQAMDSIKLAELQKAIEEAATPPATAAEPEQPEAEQAEAEQNAAEPEAEQNAAEVAGDAEIAETAIVDGKDEAPEDADAGDEDAVTAADVAATHPEPAANGHAGDAPEEIFNADDDGEEKTAEDHAESAAGLAENERETLLKILAAMAIGRYGYEPQSRRNSTVTDIVRDHEKAGLKVSPGTVRKWLREASELVPGDN